MRQSGNFRDEAAVVCERLAKPLSRANPPTAESDKAFGEDFCFRADVVKTIANALIEQTAAEHFVENLNVEKERVSEEQPEPNARSAPSKRLRFNAKDNGADKLLLAL